MTEEGINYLMALTYFGRLRFANHLMPLLQNANGLRRVVSAFTGAREGKVYTSAWQQGQEAKVPFSAIRGHGSTMSKKSPLFASAATRVTTRPTYSGDTHNSHREAPANESPFQVTLGLEALAKTNPEISFIHDFPGMVRTNIIRSGDGAFMQVLKYAFKLSGALGLSRPTPNVEVGERHTFYCTSSKFPPRDGQSAAAGVGLPHGVSVAVGVDGQPGSGVYSVDMFSESADAKVVELLTGYRKDGTAERMWAYTESEWERATRRASS